MEIEYKPQLLMWGSGSVLDAEGNEIAKVRIESSGLTLEQQKALEELKSGDNS
jgi:hypothetical protein